MKLLPRFSALTILSAHGVAAATWLWFMPGGFPVSHSRLWTNRAGPAVVLIIVIGAFISRAKGRTPWFEISALIVPCAWLGGAISGIMTFPISARWLAPVAMIGAIVMLLGLRPLPKRTRVSMLAMVMGFVAGAMLPPLERAATPRTVPTPEALITLPSADASVSGYVSSVRLGPSVVVYPGSGEVSIS